jgi:energy-converting hydrogenase A subunit R
VFEKSFITDCEGPLTLNDNAFELCAHFIDNGDDLFKILSLYDDYLVDEVKKEDYKAGNTLKLILPFFVVENLKNEDLVNFSQEHIYVVNDSKFLLKYLQNAMNTYIVSTSYGQYIKAVSNFMEFPFKNTYFTDVNMDELNLNDEEILKIIEFKKQILENPKNYELFNDIFFNEIPKMNIYENIKNIDVIGGEGKKLAIDDIIASDNIDINEILYIGDSITDVEPLRFARKNNGISISFNGNDYPLREAQIAIVSPSAITTAVIANIYAKNDKNTVLNFINDYNNSDDVKKLFEDYKIDSQIIKEFFRIFKNINYPLIKIVSQENFDDILEKSVEMRNRLRGQDIGGLG